MIELKEAQKIVLESIGSPKTESLNLIEAYRRILAEDVKAGFDSPPFDSSAMDGYAVLSSDTLKASKEKPIPLKIVEDLPAGSLPSRKINPGEAVKIMTGAPIPNGADAVVMVEDTYLEGDNVYIFKEIKKGGNIRKRGEDIRKDEIVLSKGTRIGAAEVGILASLGYKTLKVYSPPKVAIIATGEELIEPGEEILPGKIYNCNNYSLAAQVLEVGAIPFNLGIAGDSKEKLLEKIEEASFHDLIITTGGVSIGEYDLVKDVLIEAGFELLFWKVAIKPGKPTLFGLLNGRPFFGLPGYPVSSMVTFELFVRPAILKLLGAKELFRPIIKVRVLNEIKKKTDRTNYLRVAINYNNEKKEYEATLTGPQASGILSSMLRANGLLIVPKETPFIERGTELDAILLR